MPVSRSWIDLALMSTRQRQRRRGAPQIPVIDLFAGPGGLGEGFSAPPQVGGTGRFRIALSIEKDPRAHETLELRALVRQFPHGEVPEAYYEHVRGRLSREELWQRPETRQAAETASQEAWCAELGVTPHQEVRQRVRRALEGAEESVLIGGPPCQAYSLVGRSRNRGNPDYDPAQDHRHTLYREYLRVLAEQWPAVFVMENVKGLLSATLEQESILQRILEDLHEPARALGIRRTGGNHYKLFALTPSQVPPQQDMFEAMPADVRRFVVRCEEFGIPQARHRVIIVGVRGDLPLPESLALETTGRTTAEQALRGLPRLRSGLSDEADTLEAWRSVLAKAIRMPWFRAVRDMDGEVADAISAAVGRALESDLGRGDEFVRCRGSSSVHRDWYSDPRLGGALNHQTRAHIADDLHRYLYAAACASVTGRSPVLRDFPVQLRPNHANVREALEGSMFGDRFRVQLAGRPATTVTSHIAKDGHYYIHFDPSQCRSLTVREAARLQTFPDNYRFCGGRTAQYQQVGNAVPPLLAVKIAHLVAAVLD